MTPLWGRRSDPVAGPTLVLLHGAGGSAQSFDRLWEELEGLNRLAVTMPGRLESPGSAPTTVEEAVDWLLGRLDTLDVTDFVLVGHSYGGAVAMEAALRGTPSIAGIVLLGTGARIRVHPMILNMVEQAATTGITPPTPPGIWRPTTSSEIIQEAERAGSGVDPRAALADWQASNAFDRMDSIAAIELPTLVVGGSADTLTPPKYSQYLADHIPGSRLVLLENAGHLFPIEEPETVAAHIRSFVQTLFPQGETS